MLLTEITIAAGVESLAAWIKNNVPAPTPKDHKNPADFWSRNPFKVWTRGDGFRYKDAPFLEFTHGSYTDAAWEALLKLPHETAVLVGPFGSDKNDAIVIGGNVYTRSTMAISVYTKTGIARSRVMHLKSESDGLIYDIINRKLGLNRPLNIKLGKPWNSYGKVTGIDGRELTVNTGDDTMETVYLPSSDTIDMTLTIKDIAGTPTLVRK